jgi:hypothetical protein
MATTKLGPNVVAVTEGGAITLDMILGEVVFYTVPDAPVKVAKVRQVMESLGLETERIPEARKAVDVFQDAVRRVEGKRRNGTIIETKVDPVMEDKSISVYQVTRLVRDTEQRVIEHPKAMRVSFDKTTHVITVEVLETEAAEALSGAEEAIRDYYAANRATLPGQKIRNTIRGYLEDLNAENLRPSGGIYFVARRHHDELVKLRDFMAELYGDGGLFHLIPLANDETQREMLEKRFLVNTMEAIDEAMKRYADRLKDSSKTVRKDMIEQAAKDRAALGSKIAEYRELLGFELTSVDQKVQLLDQQILKLTEKAAPAR